MLDFLRDSEADFLGRVAAVSDAQWAWKPKPERWSVGECVEHIVLSNEALLGSAREALASPANPEWEEKTRGKAELLLRVMPNRGPAGSGGATAPQEIRPTGSAGRQELIGRFRTLYAELREMVQTTEAPLKAHTVEHPFPFFNTLSAYDWILYVPLHTIRHTRQMIEVMETDGYPSS